MLKVFFFNFDIVRCDPQHLNTVFHIVTVFSKGAKKFDLTSFPAAAQW